MKISVASAKWSGDLKQGKGSMKLPSVSDELAFSFSSRFEDGDGATPEELIASAHAGCFSMAFSNLLAQKGFPPKLVSTEARVTMDKKGDGMGITKSALTTKAEVPGISKEEFLEIAETAKKNCPVSEALASVEITLDATLL